ncbi:putative membrane protein [Brevundimonas diminuta ATCC 11568]|nr:putative membrane protein [Brevundimonas diminuta ATCC 11568]
MVSSTRRRHRRSIWLPSPFESLLLMLALASLAGAVFVS